MRRSGKRLTKVPLTKRLNSDDAAKKCNTASFVLSLCVMCLNGGDGDKLVRAVSYRNLGKTKTSLCDRTATHGITGPSKRQA